MATLALLVSSLVVEFWLLPAPGSPVRAYEGLVVPVILPDALSSLTLLGLAATGYFTVKEIGALRAMGRLRMDYPVAPIALLAGIGLLLVFLGPF